MLNTILGRPQRLLRRFEEAKVLDPLLEIGPRFLDPLVRCLGTVPTHIWCRLMSLVLDITLIITLVRVASFNSSGNGYTIV